MRMSYFVAALLFAAPAQAADPAAMREISAIAAEICGDYQRNGSGSSYEVSGEAEAKINGLLKSLVDLGVKGAASASSDEYANVMRTELGAELKSVRECRSSMTLKLLDKLELSSAPQPQPDPVLARGPDLTGTWSFSGTCPYGFTSVPVRGEFQMQKVGQNQYSGQAFSSLGLTGQFRTVVSGTTVRSEIYWSDNSYETANGQLSQDGRRMEIVDTAGCQSQAFLLN